MGPIARSLVNLNVLRQNHLISGLRRSRPTLLSTKGEWEHARSYTAYKHAYCAHLHIAAPSRTSAWNVAPVFPPLLTHVNFMVSTCNQGVGWYQTAGALDANSPVGTDDRCDVDKLNILQIEEDNSEPLPVFSQGPPWIVTSFRVWPLEQCSFGEFEWIHWIIRCEEISTSNHHPFSNHNRVSKSDDAVQISSIAPSPLKATQRPIFCCISGTPLTSVVFALITIVSARNFVFDASAAFILW